MNARQIRQQALLDRLDRNGIAALHIKADGSREWLWGYFREALDESALNGLEIDLHDAQPLFKLPKTEAVDVQAWESRHGADMGKGSKLVILGSEYTVRKVHLVDIEARLMLGSDCCSSKIGVNPPQCRQQVQNQPLC